MEIAIGISVCAVVFSLTAFGLAVAAFIAVKVEKNSQQTVMFPHEQMMKAASSADDMLKEMVGDTEDPTTRVQKIRDRMANANVSPIDEEKLV